MLQRIATSSFAWVFLTMLCAFVFLPGITTIPPIDRDEARYIQASRQMLESGDFVRIRFQQTPRHKKPAGVHWLQVGAVQLLSSSASNSVWPYRLVSVLAAWLAVLVTFRLGTVLFGSTPDARLAACLGAAALATCLGLMSEAHQAKTDAVLCLTIVLMQLSLARHYLHSSPTRSTTPWLFYIALGAGTMVKGPVAPAVAVMTIGALCILERDFKWFTRLNPLKGAAVLIALVAPWAIAIELATGGTFFSQAASEDIVPKLISSHESHGAPPGYYLLTSFLMFWPAALLALPALIATIRQREHTAHSSAEAPSSVTHDGKARRFLLAWLIPTWLCLEIVPTKLPHYSLVLYPSLALMIGALLLRTVPSAATPRQAIWDRRLFKAATWTAIVLSTIAGLALASAPLLLSDAVGISISTPSILMSLSALAVLGAGTWLVFKQRWSHAILSIALCGALYHALLAGYLAPSLKPLWLSETLANEVAHALVQEESPSIGADSGSRPQLAISGYHEPSVVFIFGTDTVLTDAKGVIRHLANSRPSLGILPSNDYAAAIDAYISELPESARDTARKDFNDVVRLGNIRGLNYSKGKWLELNLILRR